MARYQAVRPRKAGDIPPGWTCEPRAAETRPGDDILSLLEAAAAEPYSGASETWGRLLELLFPKQPKDRLPHFAWAIEKILARDKWRTMANPRGYVSTGAYFRAWQTTLKEEKRYFIAEHCSRPHVDNGPTEALADWLHRLNTTTEAVKYHGKWVQGHGLSDKDENAAKWSDNIPPWVRSDDDSISGINWGKVAAIVVPKAYMRPQVAKALRSRFDDRIPDAEALRRQRKPEARAALVAAFKWVDRNMDSRITPVIESSTEAEARAKLSGAPAPVAPPPKPAPPITRESALREAIIRANRRCFSPEDEPGLLLDWCKYGW